MSPCAQAGRHAAADDTECARISESVAAGSIRNIFDLYSGYGVYGRHNREYTPSELVDLVSGCGYTVQRVCLEDIYADHGLTRWFKRFRQHWRDNLFVVAQ